jgi:hypothetical protein
MPDEPFEIFSDNEVILTWRPAQTDKPRDADPEPDEEQARAAA